MTDPEDSGAQLEIAFDRVPDEPFQVDIAFLALATAEHANLHSVWRFASHLRELANDLDAVCARRRALEVKPNEQG